MITTTGQSIIAKYLVDQAPAYASYIAIGCGARPRLAYTDSVTSYTIASNIANVAAAGHPFIVGDLVTISSNVSAINGTYSVTATVPNYFEFSKTASDTVSAVNLSGNAIVNFKNKETLDFEMFRIPITSRTFEQNSSTGITSVIFSGDLPSQDRYYITEAGVFSAGSNPIASGLDSRILNTFTASENWEFHGLNQAISVPSMTDPIYYTANGAINTSVTNIAFNIENTNSMFVDPYRAGEGVELVENSRMLQSSIAVSSGMSIIDTSSSVWTSNFTETVESVQVSRAYPHLHLIGRQYPFDKNSSSDQLKLALSLLAVDPSTPVPSNTYVLIEFNSDETESGSANDYAKAQFTISSSDFIGKNRYLVKNLSLGDLKKSAGFTWSSVDIIKVSVAIPQTDLTVNNKQLTDNVATLTTAETPKIIVGQVFTVAGVDSTFNGTYEATAVNVGAKTISYEKTATNVGSTASSGGTIKSSNPSHYVMLDGLRFENNRDRNNNPIYGMVSYSPVQDGDNEPALKETNSANMFEIKFNLELDVEE
jgi:hypothetical protein